MHWRNKAYCLLVAAVLTLSCSGAATKQPNLLLISLDTTRWDYLSCYGKSPVQTPNIDAVADKGVLFTRAVTTVPMTLPAHTSIMTGLYPIGHGVRNNGRYRLDETVPTIASVLKSRGYTTGAVVSAFVLDSQFGLDSGFQGYNDHLDSGSEDDPSSPSLERDGDAATDAAISFLNDAERSSSPYFLWVHYYDPHHPYEPPSPYAKMYPRNPYAGEIAYMDACVGRLLSKLGEEKGHGTTLTVIVGDHGEDLGDHGEMSHGTFLYESTMHIPLIFSLPGTLPEGVSYDRAVSVVDIFSTILDLLKVEVDTLKLQGQSLQLSLCQREGLSETPGSETSPERPIYFETQYPLESMGWSPLEGIIMGEWKYIHAPRDELYNIESDPEENTNLAEDKNKQRTAMRAVLDSLKMELTAQNRSATFDVDHETLEKLASLGYVTGPGSTGQGLRDPKDMVRVFSIKGRGVTHYERGEYELAEEAFREALEIDSSNVLFINYLALSLYQLGRMDEAIRLWKTALERNPADLDIYLNMGMTYLAMRKPQQAKWAYEKVIGMNPVYMKALLGIGKSHLMVGEIDEAVTAFERAIEEDPQNPAGRLLLGLSLKAGGDLEAALREIDQALLLKPGLKKALREKAIILVELDRADAAVEILTELVSESPSSPLLLLDLGNALDKSGMLEEALESYRKAVERDSTLYRAHNNMGTILDRLGRETEAERELKEALLYNADFPEAYYNLGLLYTDMGRRDEARMAYSRFLSLWKHQDETRERAERALKDLGGSSN